MLSNYVPTRPTPVGRAKIKMPESFHTFHDGIGSVSYDTWLTPPSLWYILKRVVDRAALDVVPFPRPLWDALKIPWPKVGVNFVNPPYSRAAAFIAKATSEMARGAYSILLLSEVGLDTVPTDRDDITISEVRGRIRFNNPWRPQVSREAPFKSFLVAFGHIPKIPTVVTGDGSTFRFDDWQPPKDWSPKTLDPECFETVCNECGIDLVKCGGEKRFVDGGKHFIDRILTVQQARKWINAVGNSRTSLFLLVQTPTGVCPSNMRFEAYFHLNERKTFLVSTGPRRSIAKPGPDPTRVRLDLGESLPKTPGEDYKEWLDNSIRTTDRPQVRRYQAPKLDELLVSTGMHTPQSVLLNTRSYDIDFELFARLLRSTNYGDHELIRCCETAGESGFPIGFNGPPGSVISTNSERAYANAPKVHEMLQHDEFTLGFLSGGISLSDAIDLDRRFAGLTIRTSPMFTVDKKESDKLRLIYHGSYPFGNSVNTFIKDPGIVIKLHDGRVIAERLARLQARNPGVPLWLWSGDISKAYRLIPIDQRDVPLLGFVWFDLSKPLPPNWENPDPSSLKVYFYNRAPFGLSTSVFWWHRIARGIRHLFLKLPGLPAVDCDLGNYVDDFCGMVASHDPLVAGKLASRFKDLCELLNVPLNMKKWKRGGVPQKILQFIGLEFDAIRRLTKLPVEKIVLGKKRISQALRKKFLRLKDLESLTGTLMYAAMVSDYARLFLRRCFDAIRDTRRLNRRVTPMTHDLRADLKWFLVFWSRCNGKRWTRKLQWTKLQEMRITTDASTTGFGCFNAATGEYMHGQWPVELQTLPIHILEMVALFAAILHWGSRWKRRRVVFDVDNMSVVWAFNNFYCKDPGLAIILREVFLLVQKYQFDLRARHIRTDINVCSDALSRSKLALFELHAFLHHLPFNHNQRLTRNFVSKQVWRVAHNVLTRSQRETVVNIPKFYKKPRMDSRLVYYKSTN